MVKVDYNSLTKACVIIFIATSDRQATRKTLFSTILLCDILVFGGIVGFVYFFMSESEYCSNCHEAFTILNRKHHCRVCGRLLCHTCCQQWLLVALSLTLISNAFVEIKIILYRFPLNLLFLLLQLLQYWRQLNQLHQHHRDAVMLVPEI